MKWQALRNRVAAIQAKLPGPHTVLTITGGLPPGHRAGDREIATDHHHHHARHGQGHRLAQSRGRALRARPFDLPERYAIIPIEPGPAPAAAIAIGNIEQVLEYIPQSHAREKAEAELAHARVTADQIRQAQAATTKLQVAAFADGVVRLKHRLDQFEQRKAEQVRRDAEEAERREAERIAAHVAALPDVDDPDTWDGPRPSGELTPIAASHPADKRQLAALDQGA